MEITLAEALSWCAFGRAIPSSLWNADLDGVNAD